MSAAILTLTTAAVAADRPAPASIAASIGTMSGNNEDVPPHLFATASDGEAFVKMQCQELRRDAAVISNHIRTLLLSLTGKIPNSRVNDSIKPL